MGFTEEWGNVYNKSIQAFTGRNKVAVRELDDVVKGTTPLVQSLVRLDKNDPRTAKTNEMATALKAFSKEMNDVYTKEKKKYDGILDLAIKKTDKDLWPQPYRELKVLKTQLDLLSAKISSAYASRTKETTEAIEKANAAINKAQNKLREKGLTDDDVNGQTYLLKAKKLLLIFIPATKTAFAKAVAAIQTIKADPTPATYNKAMHDGGRDLSQQFSNLIKVLNEPAAKDWPLVKKMPDLRPFHAALADFGNGAKQKVDTGASAQDILTLLGEFSTMVKGLGPIYAAITTEVKKMK